MKHIVVCSDGTGNTDIKGRGTNVFKLYEAVDVIGHRLGTASIQQIAFYDDGVGTERALLRRILGSVAGWGLSRNVKELYTEVARVYEPGDKLFLFGFSRGAFTVRTLAGMITNCGIVDIAKFPDKSGLQKAVKRIYREYRKRYRTILGRFFFGKPGPDALAYSRSVSVRDDRHAPDGRIELEFIGVWDTVDAVGLPFHISDISNELVWRFKFPDPRLSNQVKRACHALAIDEERHSFKPVLWENDSRIQQVWFAGVHSNIGGGYPRQGMSLVSLDWMMAQAEKSGLRLLPQVRNLYAALQNVDDKLYDPRAGLGVFYRWRPRNIRKLCAERNITEPCVHISAIERAAHGTDSYAPGNLPPTHKIVSTPWPGSPPLSDTMIENINATLERARKVHMKKADLPLLDELRLTMTVGFASYYVFLASVLWGVYVAISSVSWAWRGIDVNAFVRSVADAALAVATDPPFLIGLGAAWLLAYAADTRVTRFCTSFWHKTQRELKHHLWPSRTASEEPAAQQPLESARSTIGENSGATAPGLIGSGMLVAKLTGKHHRDNQPSQTSREEPLDK